jgi:hypothetical protein
MWSPPLRRRQSVSCASSLRQPRSARCRAVREDPATAQGPAGAGRAAAGRARAAAFDPPGLCGQRHWPVWRRSRRAGSKQRRGCARRSPNSPRQPNRLPGAAVCPGCAAGLRLIDLCREVFDVVVMKQEPALWPAAGWGRSPHAPASSCPASRSGGRRCVLGVAKPEVMADLGHGVMDDAMVEAAAYRAGEIGEPKAGKHLSLKSVMSHRYQYQSQILSRKNGCVI